MGNYCSVKCDISIYNQLHNIINHDKFEYKKHRIIIAWIIIIVWITFNKSINGLNNYKIYKNYTISNICKIKFIQTGDFNVKQVTNNLLDDRNGIISFVNDIISYAFILLSNCTTNILSNETELPNIILQSALQL